MTIRSRDAACAAVAKFTAGFAAPQAPLIPTAELRERLGQGEDIILVDVRTPEEQLVSMIPGAVTQAKFEAEVLPKLLRLGGAGDSSDGPCTIGGASDTWVSDAVPRRAPLVVPYCTVGYRSGLYCRELFNDHGLRHLSNGEGIIMWTFDGGDLVRPEPGPRPLRAPPLTSVDLVDGDASSSGGAAASSSSAAVCGRAGEAERSFPLAVAVREVHVFGKPWDIAAEGYRTVYFSNMGGALRYLRGRLHGAVAKMRKHSQSLALWSWALALFYLLFTPACGVMYHCGCRLAISKWGQVETCNIFGGVEEVHRCPWCSCSGLSCIFVASDSKALRDIPLLDLVPDGSFLTLLTVAVLWSSWRLIDSLGRKWEAPKKAAAAFKALLALLWFFAYCLVMGGLFFVFAPEYPYFLGLEREGSVSQVPAVNATAVAGAAVPYGSSGGSGRL